MRIGFEVTPLCAPQSGVGTYTSNLLDHLDREFADEIVPLANRPMRNARWPVMARPYPLNKTLWMQVVLPLQLRRLQIDVCHFTNSVAPLWSPCPTVVTIHDMTLWLFPEHHYSQRLLAMRPIIPLAARRASRIIANSWSTRNDIVRILGVPEEKVEVIYEAPPACFRPLQAGPELEAARRDLQLPEHFLLYVGTIEPRKNLVRLLQAFARLPRDGTRPDALVLVGQRGWKDSAVFSAVERLGLSNEVRYLGYVPQEPLVALYNLADAVVFPSLHEGFGLPVVEAMACGTPVVTSRNGSLGEVAGEAAEFVEPTDVASIAAALRRVLGDSDRRAGLREKGLVQAARFSWSNAAAQTRRVYARALGGQRLEPVV